MSIFLEVSKIDRKYAGWLWVLKLIGKANKVFTDNTQLSPRGWRPYYDEGMTPLEALWYDFKSYSDDTSISVNK